MQKAPVYYPMMDVVRYILSLGVLYCHVLFLTDSTLPTFNLSFYSVGGFFALSGFLMYPNYTRHMQPWLYVRHRARRILPPYFFIVLLCALTLWSVSSCGVGEYFSAPVFWKYLGANLTFLNWFEPALPGVFDSSGYVDSAVNGSLWTMKVEWCLYLSLPVFVWICRKLKTRFAYVAVTVILFSIIWRICLYSMYVGTGKQIYEILGRQVMGMLAYFYCGVILYFTRDQIQKRPWFWITMGLLLIVIGNLDRNAGFICFPPGISLLVIAVSMTGRTLKIPGSRDNVSYEIYLFHYPVIQLLIPLVTGWNPWATIGLSLALTVALSSLYHFAIAPLLTHRQHR